MENLAAPLTDSCTCEGEFPVYCGPECDCTVHHPIQDTETAIILHHAASHLGESRGWSWAVDSADSKAYATLMALMYAAMNDRCISYEKIADIDLS